MLKKFDHGGDIYSREITLDFSVNINPLGMPDAVRDAIVNSVDTYKNYPDPQCRKLRAVLSDSIGCSPDWILCGSGAADLIIRLCLATMPKRTLVCAPTFSEYEKGSHMSGAEVRKHILFEENDYSLTEKVFDDMSGVDIFFLCNPNNPTGALTDSGLILKIADECERRGILFALDECFLSFTGENSAVTLLASHKNMLIFDAFTKLYSIPGLRLGYTISANLELLKCIRDMGQSWSVSGPAQAAGIAALSVEPEWTARTRELVANETAYLRARLRGLGLKVWDGAANYTMFKAPKELGDKLLKRKILIRSCANYTGLSPEHFRVGIKTRNANDVLINAISEELKL